MTDRIDTARHCFGRAVAALADLNRETEELNRILAGVQAEILPALVRYRDDLPTEAQVRAHEANGGLWMRWNGRPSLPEFAYLDIDESRGRIRYQQEGREGPARALSGRFRPCLGDGTPVPWPGGDGAL